MFLCRLCGNTFDADRKLCRRTFSDRSTPINEYRRGFFPFWEASSAVFLVYIVAILFYEPIFTQPLSFGLCAAGAVEKFATERAVGVVYLRDSIGISKINAAFLTGQQIDRIHVQQLLLPSFMCQGAQHLLLYHVPSPKTIAFLTKDTRKNFPLRGIRTHSDPSSAMGNAAAHSRRFF